jgi:predicted N-acetyltransferase YhbS
VEHNPELNATLTTRPLAAIDPAAVEALLDRAFGTDRHGRTAYRLRAGCTALPGLSRGVMDGDALIATIQCWPVALERDAGGRAPMILVGPVAVAPERQRDGLGRRLMAEMLAAAGPEAPLMLIGDPEYYGRFFGFTAERTGRWRLPGPFEARRLLARGAVEDAPGLVVPDPAR